MTESMEHLIRRVVREEIKTALERLALSAEREDGYESDHIESTALNMIKRSATSAVGMIDHTPECAEIVGPRWHRCDCKASDEG